MCKLDNYSELPSVQGIYFITNTINQKYYLGRAVNIKDRYSWKDIEYSHHNYLLRDSILKYGRENFIVSVVEYPNISLEELINIEQGLLDIHYGLPLCDNLSPFATGGIIAGENHPCYGKIKINNVIEEKYISPDEDIPKGYALGRPEIVKQKCSEGSVGKKHSKETRQKMSEDRQGDKHPNYGRIIINDGIEEKFIYKGIKLPEGFVLGRLPGICEKISEAMKGENSPQYGKKCYNNGIEHKYFFPEEEIPEGYILGVKEETRRNQSEVTKGKNNPMYSKTHSEETRQKCSEAMKSINFLKKIPPLDFTT